MVRARGDQGGLCAIARLKPAFEGGVAFGVARRKKAFWIVR